MVSVGGKLNGSSGNASLTKSQIASLAYHDIFDYPLSRGELVRWKIGVKVSSQIHNKARKIGQYYVLEGKESSVKKRQLRNRSSLAKLIIAEKAAKVLGTLPSVKMVGITGALAMMNAEASSDIDLLIICSSGTLWTTRLIVYALLDITGVLNIRHGKRSEKDKLCLNMWLDERALSWDENDRNIYTAHEITQIIPLVNKDKTYEKLIKSNSWVSFYWPNAVKPPKSQSHHFKAFPLLAVIEPIARLFQVWYMQKKRTREVVTPTRAIFHPRDWGKIVGQRLSKYTGQRTS